MNIGENIRKFRKAKGLTQAELGELVGVSNRVISYYENEEHGSSIPHKEMLKRLEIHLGVDKSELLGYEKPQTKIIKTDISYFTTDELLKEIYRRTTNDETRLL